MHKYYLLLFVLCIANIHHGFANQTDTVEDTIVLQLKWKHQFQFAGYYAALSQGYYKKAGLKVKICEAKTGDDAIPSVVTGKSQYGIASSDLILSRAKGLPVVLLANIHQHSPYVFLTLDEGKQENIHDLAGHSIMLESNAAELLAYLNSEKIRIDQLKFIPHTFSPDDLIQHKVYAISAYSTDEPFLLMSQGIKYNVFNPRSSSIDFYGDVLFTSEAECNQHPDRVKAFLDASLQGWKYALSHKDEMIDLIYSNYTQRHSKEHLQFEAEQTERLIMEDVVEIGYVNPNRWKRIAEVYAELNMLPAQFSLDGFIFERNPKPDNRPIYYTGAIILSIIVIISFIALRFFRLNQRLKIESKERKAKETELIRLEERYRKLLENAPFSAFLSHPETGDIVYINQQASDKLQIIKDLAKNKKISFFFANEDEYTQHIDQVNQHGFVKRSEIQMKNAGGKVFWVLISSNLIVFDDKNVLFSAIIDITDRIELEQGLKEANATKDKFFSIIAHDLRGPIGGLTTFSDNLKFLRAGFDEAKFDSFLDVFKKSAQTAYELLENLLLWAQSQKNEIKFTPEKNNLSALIQSNIDLLSTALGNKNIVVINQCQDNVFSVFDQQMINTVIRNLLNNAMKYTPMNGRITISAQVFGNNVRITIEDTGIGMSKSTMDNLFSIANKQQSVLGTKDEIGTGLGLIICADFIKKHGGKIEVESTLGVGSKFSFTL